MGNLSAMKSRFLALALISVAACNTEKAPAVSDKVEVGQPAPAYAALAMSGDSVSLAKLRGSVVLLNVWATWCGPCRKEIPELRALHANYKDRGLQVIGVSVDADGSDSAIQDFLKEFKMDYTVWRDPSETVQALFRMSGVPTTFVIDRKGVMRWRSTGAIEPGDSSLTRAIEAALR